MDLTLGPTEVYVADDTSWLASRHGVDSCRSITIDMSTLTEADHYPNGFIPSGMPLTAQENGLWGLWTTGDTLAGVLFARVKAPRNDGTNVSGALLEHGRVVGAKLPVPVDAAGQATASGRLIFA